MNNEGGRISFKHEKDRVTISGGRGSMVVNRKDEAAWKMTMLVEGACSPRNVEEIAGEYGYSKPRYYQVRDKFADEGSGGLTSGKRGPKKPHKRSEEAVRQIIRYRYLDRESSPEVIAQKLRQNGFDLSVRTVFRVFEDYGLQKKGSINAILRRARKRKKP